MNELIKIAVPWPNIGQLLANAANTVHVLIPPQVPIVLAARVDQSQTIYPELGYNLILKEAGAVLQTVVMFVAAMSVAICPIGCGNSTLFLEVVNVDPVEDT